MIEEPSESEKYILLRQELNNYLEIFEQAYSKVIVSGITSNPILILHKDDIAMGVPIVSREMNGGNWNVHISWMEEFVAKQLIRAERVEEFQALYERKKEQYCLFVLSDLGAKFVFIPRIRTVD